MIGRWDSARGEPRQTLPDLPPVDVERVLREAATAYIADCRARVAPFVDRHFCLAGAVRLHRVAVGGDLLRAPANLALAVPQVALKEDDSGAEGKLSLAFGTADFSAPGEPESKPLGTIQIAQNDTSDALLFAGPDWPAVGILPSQQVAVAWIQPGQSGTGTDLHVQRYKMCLPPQ